MAIAFDEFQKAEGVKGQITNVTATATRRTLALDVNLHEQLST